MGQFSNHQVGIKWLTQRFHYFQYRGIPILHLLFTFLEKSNFVLGRLPLAETCLTDSSLSLTLTLSISAVRTHAKPCRIASIDGNPALDVFRQQSGGW